MSRPWLKWYPRDWRADPRLRMCSLAARGAWIEMIGYMHEAEPYGHLLIDGRPPNDDDLAALVGRPIGETRKAVAELRGRGVFSLNGHGIIYSRRMVREHDRSEEGREHVRKRWHDRSGGSPPNRSPTEEPITQKPESRVQKEIAVQRAREPLNLLAHWPWWLEIAKAIGADIDDPNWFSQHGRVAQWQADGWSLDLDIMPTIQRLVAARKTKGKRPIRRLEFFEEAIADAHATRKAPVPVGQPRTTTHEPDRDNSLKGALARLRDATNERADDAGDGGGEAPTRLLSHG